MACTHIISIENISVIMLYVAATVIMCVCVCVCAEGGGGYCEKDECGRGMVGGRAERQERTLP